MKKTKVDEILKKYETGIAPGRKSPEQYAQMRKDADILRSAANKRIARLEKNTKTKGIQSPAYNRAKETGMFNNGNRFTTKVDDKALPGLINAMRRFMNWKTSTVKGVNKVMIKNKREQLRQMVGATKTWAKKNITADFLKKFWNTYNKMKELPGVAAKMQVAFFISERILEQYQKAVFSDLSAFRKNPEEALYKAEQYLNDLEQEYERQQNEDYADVEKLINEYNDPVPFME